MLNKLLFSAVGREHLLWFVNWQPINKTEELILITVLNFTLMVFFLVALSASRYVLHLMENFVCEQSDLVSSTFVQQRDFRVWNCASRHYTNSGAPTSIHPVLSVQPDHCSSNLAVQNTLKYSFINYHNTIHVSVSWQITQTPKTETLILLFYN